MKYYYDKSKLKTIIYYFLIIMKIKIKINDSKNNWNLTYIRNNILLYYIHIINKEQYKFFYRESNYKNLMFKLILYSASSTSSSFLGLFFSLISLSWIIDK